MRRTLLSIVSMPVSSFQRERLAAIDLEDFDPVIRKVREEYAKVGVALSDEDAAEGILALKQYYAVALLDPLNRHAVSDAIDPFWHAHILHTKQYHAFCHQVFGEYVHHEPLDHANAHKVREVEALYAYTVSVYALMFRYVSPSYFPSTMPTARMVCLHDEVTNQLVRNESAIAHAEIAA